MRCPICNSVRIRVTRTHHDTDKTITRYRACSICEHRWFTVEHLCPGSFKYIDGRSVPTHRSPDTSLTWT